MRNELTLAAITTALQRNCGDRTAAAQSAGVSPLFLERWIRDDSKVKEAVEEAQRVGFMGLESEAIRRGVHGIDEAVWYKGEVVGSQRKYSDTLLAKMLEARTPEYSKKDVSTTANFNGPTQINIMPRAENYDQWLEIRATEEARRKAERLPAPEVVEDAVFEDVRVLSPVLGGLGI